MPIVGGPFSSLYVGDAQATDRRPRTFRRAVSPNSYLTTPATLGNHVSTPDAAALDITGDIEIVAHIAPTDWTPAGGSRIVTKRIGAPGGNYEFTLEADGTLGFANSYSGGAVLKSSAATGFTDGDPKWTKVTYRDSDGRVQFFTAATSTAEPTSWAQLGTDRSQPSGFMVADTNALWIGAIGTAFTPFGGRVYRAIVRNGIGGAAVADFNPNLYSTGSTFTSTDGLVYTLSGTAAITKA